MCEEKQTFQGPGTPSPKRATSRSYTIKGTQYHPQPHYELIQSGHASWYGGRDSTHGRPTASGERFNMHGLTAAHRTLPLPCVIQVTNLENGRTLKLKVNDRGPFPSDLGPISQHRILDVSARAAKILGFYKKGTARIQIRTLVHDSLSLPENRRFAKERPHLLAQKPAPKPQVERQAKNIMPSLSVADLIKKNSVSSPHHRSQRNIPQNQKPTGINDILKAHKMQEHTVSLASTQPSSPLKQGRLVLASNTQRGFFIEALSPQTKASAHLHKRLGLPKENIILTSQSKHLYIGPFSTLEKAEKTLEVLKNVMRCDRISILLKN